MTIETLGAQLERLGTVLVKEPMSRHTTFGIGGPADLFVKVRTRPALQAAMQVAVREGVPFFVLGSGSNILVGDRGMSGVVIANEARTVDGPTRISNSRARLSADSGMSFASLARRTCRAGFWGLEWAIGIPGTLGGAVVYNAGAYGGCLADVLMSVEVAAADGSEVTLPASELKLEYRGSLFTRGLFRNRTVLSVDLQLRFGDQREILSHVASLDTKRKTAQPAGRSAGSLFKNPPERPAWWYIDQVGLRGARIGGAEISAKHANFFLNVAGARAADVTTLMDEARRRVRERFGVELQNEVALIGRGFCEAGLKS